MEDKFVSFLSRHLVMLTWIDEPKEGDIKYKLSNRRVHTVSTFVLSWRDTWYLLTAGHILDDIEKMVADDRQIVKSQLWDGHVYGASNQMLIQFDLEEAPKYSATHTVGQDFGLITLRPYYRNLLESNNVKAFVESTWTNIPDDLDNHVMVGLPKMLQSPRKRSPGNFTAVGVNVVVMPVRPVESVPRCLVSDKPRFYGQLDDSLVTPDGVELTDIDGMSGGPVMGYKRCKDGRLRYWLIAVQSSWAPQSRVISAAPIYVLEQMFLEAEAVMQKYAAIG